MFLVLNTRKNIRQAKLMSFIKKKEINKNCHAVYDSQESIQIVGNTNNHNDNDRKKW